MASVVTPKQMIKAMSALGYVIGLCQDNKARLAAHLALNDVSDHIEALEALLDEGDQQDAFGTEGWRHRAGID